MIVIIRLIGTTVALMLGTLLISATLRAEIGTVTVDDELIPQDVFLSYELYYENRGRPPKSDSCAREAVVMFWLLAREVRRQGIVFEGADKRHVDGSTQRLERLPVDAPNEQRLRMRWELLEQVGRSFVNVMVGDIDEATMLERYRRAIKEGHPELVNLTLLRRTDYTLANAEARDEVQKMIESGRSIAELERENLLGSFDPYQSEEWEAVEGFDYLHPEQAAALIAGDIIYPDKFHQRGIVHVHETKILSRVRPYHPINGDDYFARRVARRLEFTERRLELESSLRKEARVEENNVLVEAEQTNPECDHW